MPEEKFVDKRDDAIFHEINLIIIYSGGNLVRGNNFSIESCLIIGYTSFRAS